MHFLAPLCATPVPLTMACLLSTLIADTPPSTWLDLLAQIPLAGVVVVTVILFLRDSKEQRELFLKDSKEQRDLFLEEIKAQRVEGQKGLAAASRQQAKALFKVTREAAAISRETSKLHVAFVAHDNRLEQRIAEIQKNSRDPGGDKKKAESSTGASRTS